MKRYAAIDLGTNTFHMIIVEKDNKDEINVINRSRHFVKLAYGGFKNIDDEAIARGIDVLTEFKSLLKKYKVDKYLAFGTSMFRRSSNGIEFSKRLEEKTGIKINIIDGNLEAKLIFNGAKLAGALRPGYNLIMDIGGGSVEFIISDTKDIVFKKSYPIGIIELYHKFKHLEPFNKITIGNILEYIKSNAPELQKEISKYNISTLIGTAGSFEVLHTIKSKNINDHLFDINPEDFNLFFESVAYTTHEERLKIDSIPKERKRLIVYAFLLIKFSLKISQAPIIRVTSYSMKEGMINELINEKD
jgi:exopolyphosphatase/guanosine-5'-triphosphate,3'-diphosphate pyrophosphatase